MRDLPILILAAGQSRRMRGVDKLLALVDGVPLLHRQIAATCAVSSAVYAALPAADHPRAAIVARSAATPIIVDKAAEGVGVSLRESVAALPPCPAFMVVLADLVALEAEDYAVMITAYEAHPDHLIWRGATAQGKPGHPIIFASSLRPAFATLNGDQGGAAILKAHAKQTRPVILPDDRALLDLDTPQDWEEWRIKTGR